MGAILPVVYVPMPIEHLGMNAVVSLCAFVAGLLMIAAYRKADAAIVAPMQYSQLLWAAFYGALLFGEDIDAVTWTGGAVIIASGLLGLLPHTEHTTIGIGE